jgi:hypothetical protein
VSAVAYSGAFSHAFAYSCYVCGEADSELLCEYDVVYDDGSRTHDDLVDSSSDAVLCVSAVDA